MSIAGDRFDALGADGAPARLGIMGGTFDPVHIGHLRIAEEVREALGLDAVLFIPAGNPVFKKGQRVTDAATRLRWVRQAVSSNPHFDVCSIEVDRKGDTFTVDTLRELRAHYPENVTFYFIIGSDAAASIGKWRKADEIARMAHLAIAIGRPGYASKNELEKAILSEVPFDLHFVDVSALEVSSSAIRGMAQAGKSIRYLVPACIEQECRKVLAADAACLAGKPEDVLVPDGRRVACDANPLSKEFYKARKAELKQRVSAKRFEHSLGVSKACVNLAKTYGVQEDKARLAGLLHDWDKWMNDEEARARVAELGMIDDLDPWVVENMPRVLHGYTAARALQRDFPDIPADVLQAIDRHTTAAVDMEPLDMVLYVADAIEPSRTFGQIDDLRAAVGTVSLEELYYQTYDYWTFLLFERKKPLHPDTMRIWNANVMRRNARRKKD